MAVLSVHNLGKHFGERVLFEGVGFEVNERDKIGLVGENGCGKTTLFRMLTGEYAADVGEVVTARDTRVGYMEQHACTREERTLWEEVLDVFSPVMAVERELNAVTELLEGEGQGDAALIERQHMLREKFEDMGGLYYRNRVKATLLGLGFEEEAFHRSVSSLSGGQRSKAAMGRLLLSDSNLLLLDEPTNHLDIAAVEWLEEFLRSYTGALVVISHDRYFLDRVTTRTLELCHGRLYASNGSYSVHHERRKEERAIAERHYKSAMRDIQHVENSIATLKRFNREKSIRAAESKEKQLERMREQIEIPESELDHIHFAFTAAATSGNEVLNAEDLSMGFGGKPLFRDVTFGLRRGERVFLLGPNGCGKTTLLKILCERLQAIGGDVRLGSKVSIGYYDQTQSGLDNTKTVIEEIWHTYPKLTQTEVRSALAAFLFRGESVFQPVRELSGGERARVLLLKLMLARDNLLLLDEPTNHLDITAREALEDALDSYDGTIFIVSHDRYFINRLATRVLRLTEKGCRSFPGNYDEYLTACQEEPVTVAAVAPPKENAYKKKKERESARRKLATSVKRTEEQIAAVEQNIAALEARMQESAADYTELLAVSKQLNEENERLLSLMEEWERLQLQSEEMDAEMAE